MITDTQALVAMDAFLADAIRIGLTITEARTVIKLSLALNLSLPQLIDELERKPGTLAKLRMLSA